MKRRLVVEMLH